MDSSGKKRSATDSNVSDGRCSVEHEEKIKPYLLQGHEKPKNLGYDTAGIEYVRFGKYPQGANGEIEPIIWRVLDIAVNEENQKTALLMSELTLDRVPYHKECAKINWKNSNIRGWLNGDKIVDGDTNWKEVEPYINSDSNKSFYEAAFSELTEDEKGKYILPYSSGGNGLASAAADDNTSDTGNDKCPATTDYVFLLNTAEAGLYFEEDGKFNEYDWNPLRQAEGTKYAATRGLWQDDGEWVGKIYAEFKGKSFWWLRNRDGGGGRSAAYVCGSGEVGGVIVSCLDVNVDLNGVRPCIRVRF
ncbi:MAG: DUF6273 domain-containing protein [Clostridiaceae bacterium]|jgi:hypothetical protein|nr:DUF6273 domain-containing protein [Clostridiaceae bacterium]